MPLQSLHVGAYRQKIGADNLRRAFVALEYQRGLTFQSRAFSLPLLKLCCEPNRPLQFDRQRDRTDEAQQVHLGKSSTLIYREARELHLHLPH